ncbi:MAG: hypothetical protein JO051_00850 [Acidobacteriaceae bacterium]|nr:hypothetical protein [Acidobacteriaceae bacterium]
MHPEKKVITLTKAEGALRQVNAAIEAFWRGDFDIAITLSGAAEGMLDRKGSHLFAHMRDASQVQHVPKKEWIGTLNQERDWLKHNSPEHSTTAEIHRGAAAIMISRAASKLENWTPQIEEFRDWLSNNLDDL